MRPHRLRFAGIGPYPDLVEIDFDDLSALGLYLIIGPTGAGKTTIFDAITFALYGKVAGERPVNGLVSDHQHVVVPFVELDFSHRDRHYRVYRRPVVDGKAPKPGDIRFTEFVDDDYAVIDHTVTGNNVVNKSVAELIGLDATQFMRVMLLPQNEFQRFLLANSTDKEPLLRALFGTRLFEQIADQILDSAKALWKNAEAKKEELEQLRYVIRDVVDNLEAAGLAHDLPDPDEALADLVEMLGSFVDKAKVAQAAAVERSSLAIEAFTKAERDAERFDAAATIKELERDAKRLGPKVADAGERIKVDERALRAAEALLARDHARTEADEAKAIVSTTRAAVGDELPARFKAPVLIPLRAAAPTASPGQLTSELSAAMAKVDAARNDFAQAAVAEAKAVANARLEQTHLVTSGQAAKKILTLTAELKTTKDTLTAAKKLAKGFPKLDRDLRELDSLLAAADVTGTRKTLAAAQGAATKATTAYDKANEALAAAREARTRHLAGELAETLVDGEACPVCGSVEHPKKARPTADHLDVTSLEIKRDKAYTTFNGAERALTDAQAAVESAEAAAAKLPAIAEQKTLRKNHASAAEATDQLDELDESVDELTDSLGFEEKRQTEALKDADAAAQQQATFRSQADRHRSQAVAAVDESLLDTVQKVLDRTERCITAFDMASQRQVAAVGERDQAVAQATLSLQREGFTKETEVARSMLDEATRSVLRTLLDEDVQRNDSLKHLRGVVGKAAPPAKRPDVVALATSRSEAQVAHAAATERANALGGALSSIKKQQSQIAKLGPDVDRMIERAKRAYHIAAVVTKGQQPLLGLERWVQRTVFEEVCAAASDQIRVLSHGRYVLTLESNGQRSRTRAAGLDLYVTDSHTGRTRPVQSLSGGEQFLTSLALALALAEVVQNRSGGIELSTLFIDEGFGSLDGDALDTAVEVLRSLQDSGRTVGLISHVEAMREELTVGIQVIPGPTGSSLKVMSVAA